LAFHTARFEIELWLVALYVLLPLSVSVQSLLGVSFGDEEEQDSFEDGLD
jgi:hypothetical protein